MRFTCWLAIALVACKSAPPPPPKVDVPGDCLPLPGAARTAILADPQGGGLYWFEPVRELDYSSGLNPYSNLVRYDLATRKLDVIIDHVMVPLHAMLDKIIVLHTVGAATTLAMIDRDGVRHLLLPDYLTPVDAEVIDDHTLAVLADGDGPRAVYTLDLHSPRPHYLIDADVLLSTWAGRVLIITDKSEGIAIDINGHQKPLSLPADATHPEGQDAFYVADSVVHVRRMFGGEDRVLVSDHKPWTFVNQSSTVLARSPPENNSSSAYLLSANTAKPLPTVLGGGSIFATAQLGTQTWALVAHNTANFVGDLIDTEAEADVCLLPATGTVTFKTRSFPKRYADKVALVTAAAPDAVGLQILDSRNTPTTLLYEVKEPGGADLATMRKRARTIQKTVTSLLGDREIRTEVRFADERTAIERWRRDRLRFRSSAGMGDVLLSDPTDFDLEVKGLANARKKDKIACSGVLVNMQARPIEHLELRCIAGDRIDVIELDTIGANATVRFDRAFEVDDKATPFFEVVSNGEPLEVLDAAIEGRLAKVFELAAGVYDTTRLALVQHELGPPIHVYVRAPAAFATKTEDELSEAAATAYRRYEALRQIDGLAPTTELTLTVTIERGKSYTFDGTALTPSN